MSDLDDKIERLIRGDLLSEVEISEICSLYREIGIEESNIQRVPAPVSVVGDLHGQFPDLLELLELNGRPPHTAYLFLGDYVDRGFFSVEVLLLLVCLKIRYPDKVTLIRGNHESRQVTQVYGFYDECVRKFGNSNVWRLCTEMFDYFPLGAWIPEVGVLCIHGGLSPNFDTLDEIRRIDRKREVPHEGPMSDIMWSDPDEIKGWGVSPRGAGYLFGGDVVESFNHVSMLDVSARAHQLVMEGYKYMFEGDLVTVWSAPNYCYRCGNVAAVMNVSDVVTNPTGEHSKITFLTFEAAPLDAALLAALPPLDPIAEYFV
jgi:serine/threonine-protein phosphatase 4 catalytic subunit